MSLNERAFTGAAAIVTGISYLVCAIFISVADELRDLAVNVLLHLDVDFKTVHLSFGWHVVSFLVWVIGVSLFAWVFARSYNLLAKTKK